MDPQREAKDPMLNWQLVTTIGLTQRANNIVLSSNELNDLRSIAWKCPYSDGSAVFQARAMLSEYDTIQYYNNCELYVTNSQVREINTNNSRNLAIKDITLYPNPSTGLVNIVSLEELQQVIVCDLAGQVLIEMSGKDMFDISKFAKGIYIVKVKTKSGFTISKLVKE